MTPAKICLLAWLFGVTLLLAACDKPDQPTLSLYLAVQKGNLDQVERHIAWGTDVNQLDKDGFRPLHVAAKQGDIIIVKVLLDSGADANAMDKNNHPPISAALLAGRTQIASMLKKHGAKVIPTQLLRQVVENEIADRDVVELLLRWGADINHFEGTDQTPLGIAIANADLKMVKLLIKNGADVNQPTGGEQTPLALAEQIGVNDITQHLLKNGARK